MELIDGLGQYLRGERERRHITIEQVASATKINVKLLHALENDNYELLPAKPFVRGFVSSYTRYMGMDPQEILNKFDGFLNEKSGKKFERSEESPHIFVEKETQTEDSKTWLSIVMAGFLGVALIVVVVAKPFHHRKAHVKSPTKISNEDLVTVPPPPTPVQTNETPSDKSAAARADSENSDVNATEKLKAVMQKKSEASLDAKTEAKTEAKIEVKTEKEVQHTTPKVVAPKPVPPAPVVAVAETTSDPSEEKAAEKNSDSPKSTTPNAAKLPPIPASEVKHLLIIQAKDDSWVKYQSDDRPIMEFMLRKDKKIYIRARNSIRFKTGNPNGVEISLDHKTFIPYDNGVKTMIIPATAETEFRNQPFISPKPPELSTGNQ